MTWGQEWLAFPLFPHFSRADWLRLAKVWDSRCGEQRQLPSFLFSFQKTKSFTQMVDGVFFPDEPVTLLTQKAFNPIPSIIGVNNHECGYLLPMVRIPAVPPLAPSAARHLLLPQWGIPTDDTKRFGAWSPSEIQRWSSFLSLKEGN